MLSSTNDLNSNLLNVTVPLSLCKCGKKACSVPSGETGQLIAVSLTCTGVQGSRSTKVLDRCCVKYTVMVSANSCDIGWEFIPGNFH